MKYQLDLHYGNQLIGHLLYKKTSGLFSLQYTQEWQQQGFAISPALALDVQHQPYSAYNFLDNLLPEGEARTLLAQNLGVSEKHVFSQIRSLGNDLSGAITFLDTNVK